MFMPFMTFSNKKQYNSDVRRSLTARRRRCERLSRVAFLCTFVTSNYTAQSRQSWKTDTVINKAAMIHCGELQRAGSGDKMTKKKGEVLWRGRSQTVCGKRTTAGWR